MYLSVFAIILDNCRNEIIHIWHYFSIDVHDCTFSPNVMAAYELEEYTNCSQVSPKNPYDDGAFCQKYTFWTFWRFSGWMWDKLAPFYLKRHLQHDSVPFFPIA